MGGVMKLLALALLAVVCGAYVIKSLLDRAAELRQERMHYWDDFDARR